MMHTDVDHLEEKTTLAYTAQTAEELSSTITDLIIRYQLPEPIFVTRPTMPTLESYHEKLKEIWDRQWLTNGGPCHQNLEQSLCDYLDVKHLSLFCNGTIALMVALQALRINSGEVITTPFTFPATPHVLWWNRIKPVYCDIEPTTYNIDPKRIESLISPDTKAIFPVHVYGHPCDVQAIQEIADRHGLHVIYDASHVFGVKLQGRALLEWGDMSTLSFHATKLFSTIEGGAIVASNRVQKQRIDFLKNFGINGEESVIGPGINGKMNEFQAAFGQLVLADVDTEIERRRTIAETYNRELAVVPGLTLPSYRSDVRHNYSYYPILVNAAEYGISRDQLYDLLKAFNVNTRKYFYPLCSHYSCYSTLPSSQPHELPVAERVATQVLCLPIYGTLELACVKTICQIIEKLHTHAA